MLKLYFPFVSHLCMCTQHIRTHTHVYKCVHIHMCTRVYTHVYTCTHVYTHVYTCVHTNFSSTHSYTYVYTRVHMCTHVYTHVYTWICVHVYTHVYVYECVHVHNTYTNGFFSKFFRILSKKCFSVFINYFYMFFRGFKKNFICVHIHIHTSVYTPFVYTYHSLICSGIQKFKFFVCRCPLVSSHVASSWGP